MPSNVIVKYFLNSFFVKNCPKIRECQKVIPIIESRGHAHSAKRPVLTLFPVWCIFKKNCENIFVSKEIITDIYVRFNKSVSYFTIVIHLQQIRYFTIAKSYFIIEIYLHQIRHLLQIRYFTIVKSYFTIVIYLQLHNDSGPSELIRFM